MSLNSYLNFTDIKTKYREDTACGNDDEMKK